MAPRAKREAEGIAGYFKASHAGNWGQDGFHVIQDKLKML